MIPNVEMSYYEKLGCLQNMFVNQAQETPDNIAVVSADGRQVMQFMLKTFLHFALKKPSLNFDDL